MPSVLIIQIMLHAFIQKKWDMKSIGSVKVVDKEVRGRVRLVKEAIAIGSTNTFNNQEGLQISKSWGGRFYIQEIKFKMKDAKATCKD